MKPKTLFCASIALGAATWNLSPQLHAAEFGDSTPYYEDDAWYDITEWFDGNDYNPTDEVVGRWDDETYEAVEDTGTDRDGDAYGYSGTTDNDWFYDYYDGDSYWYYPSATDSYTYGSHYYDYDNDGVYDAFTSYTDWDNDGIYDNVAYYSLNNAGSQEDQPKQARADGTGGSKAQTITGNIEKIKQVQVRGAKHTVVAVQQSGKSVNIDLGKSQGIQSLNLKSGTSITAGGPMAKVGDKSIILAKSVTVAGKEHQIDRERREFTGKVTSTRKTKVRGTEHLLAMVDASASNAGTIAVDLGPADKLNMQVEKGTQLTFTGVPVKVKDKRLILAQSVEQHNGETIQIQRQIKKNAPTSQAQKKSQ